MTLAKDEYGNENAWNLSPGANATVVKVDQDGDFQLRNPEGIVSDWIFRKAFSFKVVQEEVAQKEVPQKEVAQKEVAHGEILPVAQKERACSESLEVTVSKKDDMSRVLEEVQKIR